jgi:hypothetical protein
VLREILLVSMVGLVIANASIATGHVTFPYARQETPAATSGIFLQNKAYSDSGTGTIGNGKLQVSIAVTSGDFLVVFAGINMVLHPVKSVSDSLSNKFTLRATGEYPPGNEADAVVSAWTAQVQETGNDIITVSTSTSRAVVLVLEYSGVSGVGSVSTSGTRSNSPSISMKLESAQSAVVVGSGTFTGKNTNCGYAAPYSGATEELCIGTGGSTNNAGTIVLDNLMAASTSITVSAKKLTTNAWAMVGIELLS